MSGVSKTGQRISGLDSQKKLLLTETVFHFDHLEDKVLAECSSICSQHRRVGAFVEEGKSRENVPGEALLEWNHSLLAAQLKELLSVRTNNERRIRLANRLDYWQTCTALGRVYGET